MLVVLELSLPVLEKTGSPGVGPGRAQPWSAKPWRGPAGRFDVPLAFRTTDPLGVWHAKVTADGAVVIDRDFTVVAPPPPPKPTPRPPGSL